MNQVFDQPHRYDKTAELLLCDDERFLVLTIPLRELTPLSQLARDHGSVIFFV